MPTPPAALLLRQIRKLATPLAAISDRELLHRFAVQRDEDAFATLLHRHGPMVLRVCHRVLPSDPDAEDAFQATFLALARKASAVRWQDSAAGWLYATASHIARKVRAAAARRSVHERRAAARASSDPLAEMSAREMLMALDEELSRLPAKYSDPLVLCYLEGAAREDVALRLGCPLGTLKGRLERGKERLRTALCRRGLSLTAALAAALVGSRSAAAVPPMLARTTLHAALVTIPAVAGFRMAKIAIACCFAMVITAGAVGWVESSRPTADPAVGLEDSTHPPEAAETKRADESGDPLPEGAIARLGSSRLRTSRYRQFTPNGQRIVLDRPDGGLQFYDVPSGKPSTVIRATDVPGRDHLVGSTIGFSADGKLLAGVCWKGRSGIWETATGKLVRWLDSGRFYSLIQCEFSPDGKLLAVGAGRPDDGTQGITVGVYEVETGRQLFRMLGTNGAFAPDSKSLITWNGYSGGARQTSRLLEVPSGKVLSEFTHHWQLHDFFPPSDGVRLFEVTSDRSIKVWDAASGQVKYTVRGPEGVAQDLMYVRHAPGRRELIAIGVRPAGIWCWDRETGQPLWQVRLADKAYHPELSKDGKTLVIGDTAGTVRVLDAATGKERTTFKSGAIGHGTSVHVAPDGKTIATTSGGYFTMTIAFWDAATGKLISDLPGHVSGITAAAFAPDGKTVFTIGKDATLRSWDAATGRELSRAPAEPTAYMAVAADGQTLFTASGDDGMVRVLDARTGRRARQVPAYAKKLVGLALTADGKRLITAGRDGDTDASLVRVHDGATGTKLRELGRSDALIEQFAARPDGDSVATTQRGQRVSVWDAAGKRVVDKLGRGERKSSMEGYKAGFVTTNRIGSVGLSPDGRRLAYSDQEQGIVIVNTASGREVGQVKPDAEYQNPSIREDLRDVLAFSPDGQTLAWSGLESTAEIYLIEVRTARVRARLPGDSYPVQQLAFSPDGTRLLSAGPDGSALIWDLAGRHNPKAATNIDSCWTDLAREDAAAAYQAIRALIASPAETVALLKQHLQPVAAVDAKQLARLIADLDSEQFARREAATKELTALGQHAEPALRKALEAPDSAESRRRIEQLLINQDVADSPGEPLRQARAIEALERIGTAEARQVLTKLAAGATDARLTREAKAALERLGRR